MSYLADIVDQLYKKEPQKMQEAFWLVPNHNVGQKLNLLFAKRTKKVSWGLQIYTWSTFLNKEKRLHLLDEWELLKRLYFLKKEMGMEVGSFFRFMPWGRRFLDTIQCIDAHELDPQIALSLPKKWEESHFTSSKALKKGTITTTFWENWRTLYPLYKAFKAALLAKESAYPALHEREVLTQLQQKKGLTFPPIIGVHFHPLHPVTARILELLSERTSVTLYYEVDDHYMKGKRQEAGAYLRNYLTHPLLGKTLVEPFPKRIAQKDRTLKVVKSSTKLGQLQALSEALEELIASKPNVPLSSIAIILPEEDLLLPLLHSLPQVGKPYDLHIAYPLTASSLYGLFYALAELQVAWQEEKGQCGRRVKEKAEKVWSHPYMQEVKAYRAQFFALWQKEDIPLKEFQESSPWFPLLSPYSKNYAHFWAWSDALATHLLKSFANEDFSAEEQTIALYLKKFITRFNVLPSIRQQEISDFLRFVALEGSKVRIPFENKKGGIQIMGVSESIGLEASHVFVLSMNEGVWPKGASTLTLLPKAFLIEKGLDTTWKERAYAAYLFYRLLQQSDWFWASYYEAKEGGELKEKSRYLQQLTYEMESPLEEITYLQSAKPPATSPISIPKEGAVAKCLTAFLEARNHGKGLSPSLVNRYLSCSLCFYFTDLAKLAPSEREAAKNQEALDFGVGLHEVMEHLYRPYVGQIINGEIVNQLLRNVNKEVEKLDYDRENLLARDVLQRAVKGILRADRAYAPFTLCGVEVGDQGELAYLHTLPNGQKVKLGGVIDRIDKKGDVVRIIDYKSGGWEPRIRSIGGLFDEEPHAHNGIALQLFWYSYLYQKAFGQKGERIVPTVLSTRTLFTQAQTSCFSLYQGGKSAPIEDATPYFNSYINGLDATLLRLLDPSGSFVPSKDPQHQKHTLFPLLCSP